MAGKRLPVSLDDDDLATIAVFADPSRIESRVLQDWVARQSISVRANSEAGVVRALLRAGAESMRERALEAGYAELANDQEDGIAEQRARRARYADSVDQAYT